MLAGSFEGTLEMDQFRFTATTTTVLQTGGFVAVLDPNGTVRAARQLEQDFPAGVSNIGPDVRVAELSVDPKGTIYLAGRYADCAVFALPAKLPAATSSHNGFVLAVREQAGTFEYVWAVPIIAGSEMNTVEGIA